MWIIDPRLARYFRDADGNRWRRNGQTRTWKRNPDRFRIPVKFGLYAYDAITDTNMHLVSVSPD